MIPVPIQEAVEHLKGIELSQDQEDLDGRVASAVGEKEIVRKLKEAGKWEVASPQEDRSDNRFWYDVKIAGFFCDIKISTLEANDNANAKHAIYYFLTGQDPSQVSNQHRKFFQSMASSEQESEERDYYYLIINKKNTRDVFAVSLKGITKCHPAPNNLPFQVKWSECRQPVPRNWLGAKEFLLSTWAESIKRLQRLHGNGMPRSYPGYFDGN